MKMLSHLRKMPEGVPVIRVMGLLPFLLIALLQPSARGTERYVLTEEDVFDAIDNYESVWNTLTDFCAQEKTKCLNSCGEKAIPIDVENMGFDHYTKSRLSCSCDSACIAHGDCCYDFYDACPNEVAKFYLSSLRHTSAKCQGDHAFLSYANYKVKENSSEDIVKEPLSVKEIIDSLSLRGPAVTDGATGYQYSSLEDLRKIHPEQDLPSPGSKRLAFWKPTLQFKDNFNLSSYFELAFLTQIIQNKTKSFEDQLFFIFQPPDSITQKRMCIPQIILTCSETEISLDVKNIRIENVTLACQVLASMTFSNESRLPFKWMIKKMESNSTANETEREVTAKPFTLTTRRRYNIASTTDYIRETVGPDISDEHSICLIRFFLSSEKTPLEFSYLLQVATPSNIRVTPGINRARWNFIECTLPRWNLNQENANETSIVTGNDVKVNERSCQVEVQCADNFLFLNDVCAKPIILMFEVKAAPGTKHNEFRLGIEKLIDTSGILTDTNTILGQDPGSCIAEGFGDVRERDVPTSIYYGLYHILHNNQDENDGKYIPMSRKLRLALGILSTSELNVTKMFVRSRLCTLVDPSKTSNFVTQLLNDEGRELNSVVGKYPGTPKERNSTVITKDCERLPWAWSGTVLENPYLACETIKPLMISTRNFYSPMVMSLWTVAVLCMAVGILA